MGLEYEQLPRESAKAYAAFRTYLDLGPERSLAATGAKLGKSKVLMERWSRKFDWVGRVEGATPCSKLPAPSSPGSLPNPQPGAPDTPLPASPAQFLTRRELAAVLKISVRTIDRMVASGHLPARRFGLKLTRFYLPDILHPPSPPR